MLKRAVKKIIRTLLPDSPKEKITIKWDGKQLKVISSNGFQTRNESTITMFLQAFSEIKSAYLNKKFKLVIHTGNFPVNKGEFSYCTEREANLDDCIPDFSFVHWKEVGINSYIGTSNDLLEESISRTAPITEKLFWAGNIKTHPSREVFFKKFSGNKYFEIYNIDPWSNDYVEKRFTLADHLDYKYLIDLQGRGYSARIKYLLFMKRLLFIQERKWKSYYHYQLIPNYHFIPIKEDFSDLIEKIEWANSNPIEVNQIIENATQFAIHNLNYDSVVGVFKSKMINHLGKESRK